MFDALFEKSGLSLERLRSFCRVAEAGSFTRAAESDPNRQTLYSRQVKELEGYFSTELFRRNGRTITLTDTGRDLQRLAMEYFSALEDFTESCSGEMKSYTIGAGESLIRWMLLPKLPEIRQIAGRAEIAFNNNTTYVDQLEAIEVLQPLARPMLEYTPFKNESRHREDRKWVG